MVAIVSILKMRKSWSLQKLCNSGKVTVKGHTVHLRVSPPGPQVPERHGQTSFLLSRGPRPQGRGSSDDTPSHGASRACAAIGSASRLLFQIEAPSRCLVS